eukprot:Opistho-2@93963
MAQSTVSEGILYGMGNPLLDISAHVDTEFLKNYDLVANNAILAEEKHRPLYEHLRNGYKVEYIAGGATQNSIRVAQWMLQVPNATTYIGCIGNDEYGKIIRECAESDGVVTSYYVQDAIPTGTCACLITGKDRSLVAYLGAANAYKIEHLSHPDNWALVEKAQYYYIAGFFLTVSPDSIIKVAEHAAERNKMFCMNLSAPFICQFFQEPQLLALPYIDILFGNETEAREFAKKNNIDSEDVATIALAVAALPKVNKNRDRMVVFTQGAEPTIVAHKGEVQTFAVIPVAAEEIVDTNGAGDAFVGGFLSQLALNKSVAQCVSAGNYAASTIIKRSGCTYPAIPEFKSE